MSEPRPHARNAGPPALAIRDLVVEFNRQGGAPRAVDRVSLDVWPREIVGVIGESGSGKTMTALSAMRLLALWRQGRRHDRARRARHIEFSMKQGCASLRGDRIVLIPQDALQALNPTMPVGRQVGEPYEFHRGLSWRAVAGRVIDLLRAVKIADPETRASEYPHQFSGGMQQRAMIATGLALEPELVIADEPTTALDVTVQARILKLLREIRDERGSAILFITHELGIVAELCDWVYVMHGGRIVEDGSGGTHLPGAPRRLHPHAARGDAEHPQAERTRRMSEPRGALSTMSRKSSGKADCFNRGSGFRAVSGVSLTVMRNHTLGIVGESGSGKSTLLRMVLRLSSLTAGRIFINGADIWALRGKSLKALRRQVQPIFQNPASSFNPRHSIRAILSAPLEVHGIGTPAERRDRIHSLLRRVGLDPAIETPAAAPALGRPEAAHRHRARRHPGSEPCACRRADLGSRCLHPGPGAQAVLRHQGRLWSHHHLRQS